MVKRQRNQSISFKKDTLVWMLERGIKNPEFIKRRSRWMIKSIEFLKKSRILNLAHYIPVSLQPIMDCKITTGPRAILSSPSVYEVFQNFLGARRNRTILAQKHIRAVDGMRILDIGCGTSEILGFLPQDITYYGYDISKKYIEHAQDRFGSRGNFACKLFDAAEAERLPKFDLVMALGVLHHLSDTEVNNFIALARSALKPGGRLLTLDPCFAAGQNPVARFLISHDRGQHVRDAQTYRALAQKHFSTVRGDLTHQTWVPYTHWTMEAS